METVEKCTVNSSACVTASSANRSYGSVDRSLPRVGSFRTILRGRGVWVEMGELQGYVFRDNVLGWEGMPNADLT